jgi:thiosulfate reductase cytochrome b subunit
MSERQEIIYRHTLPIRVTHWVNALVLLVMIMSGLQIFNAHPALNFGSKTNFEQPLIAMEPMQNGYKVGGLTTLLGCQIDTTGLFGLAGSEDEGYDARGFPWTVTLPGHSDLSMGRRWHFFFAWAFVINGLISDLQLHKWACSARSRAHRS